SPRTYSIDRALSFIRSANRWLPAMVLWASWAWFERQSKAARFTMLHISASFALFLLQRSAIGIGSNGQFDLVFAIAIGIGLAFDRLPIYVAWTGWKAVRVQQVMLSVLLAGLIASPRLEFAYVLLSSDYRALATNNAAVARAEVSRLAAISHSIACLNLVICRMAGKAFVWDYFKVSQMVATGTNSWDEIEAMMRAQGISYESVDPRTRADFLFRRCPAFWRPTESQYELDFSLECL